MTTPSVRRGWRLVSGAPGVAPGATSCISERRRRHRSSERTDGEQQRAHTLHLGHRTLPSFGFPSSRHGVDGADGQSSHRGHPQSSPRRQRGSQRRSRQRLARGLTPLSRSPSFRRRGVRPICPSAKLRSHSRSSVRRSEAVVAHADPERGRASSQQVADIPPLDALDDRRGRIEAPAFCSGRRRQIGTRLVRKRTSRADPGASHLREAKGSEVTCSV